MGPCLARYQVGVCVGGRRKGPHTYGENVTYSFINNVLTATKTN